MDEDMEYQPRNREKARQARRCTVWCRCDLSLVSEIGKCVVCGRCLGKVKNRIRYE